MAKSRPVRGAVKKPGSSGTLREQKRRMGYELLREGVPRAEVAERLGVRWATANDWMKRLKAEGKSSWHDKQRRGRPQKLTTSQKSGLKRILKSGALKYGYPTELWTLKRTAEVIEKEFGVSYNVTHVWRVLRSLGLTAQVPLLRAMERDDDYIAWWVENKWPEILALAETENATILFIDESAVQSQPNVRRTWARRGSRPEIRARARREKLSVFSAVGMDGQLFFSVHGHDLEGRDTVVFLRKLLKEKRDDERLLVVWDGASIRKSGNVKRFLERHRPTITTRLFPPYAPELNPDEYVWNLAKHHDLANWCPVNKKEMRSVIRRELRTLSTQNDRVASAIRHAEIPLPPISRH
ncbi:MAG: IS630 family transposase [Nitrososphaerota archaeon]|nr:IS630 family transposase [Nitrososphaerota archaeon]